MQIQRLLYMVEDDVSIQTSPVTADTCEANVTDEGELTIKIVSPPDALNRIPVHAIRFNRIETQKIRAVLRHTA